MVLILLLGILVAVGYFLYKKKKVDDRPGLGLGTGGGAKGGGKKVTDGNKFVPNFVGKP